jgi:hypothetical protein
MRTKRATETHEKRRRKGERRMRKEREVSSSRLRRKDTYNSRNTTVSCVFFSS